MRLRSILLWVFALILMSGCKTTFKSNWRNFNAYYNTYYNAQKNYETGLRKNLDQNREYNPLQPIRIHPVPVNAGAAEFNKAIQKGADVLRRHEDSKWVDDAIALIGKAYYFRKEYFSADQKFNELYLTTSDRKLKQEAVLWRGRVLLDMELHNEGVSYITQELSLLEDTWDEKIRADVVAVLAEHYVKLENWQLASTALHDALPNLPKREYKERGYFLLGQVYEQLGDDQAAFRAYQNVENHFVEYRVQYLAKRKMAEVARDLEKYDVAFDIFNDMVRDDKNLEYKAELDFELARTEQQRKNYRQAEKLYNQVLRNTLRSPAPEIAARSYYGLGDIYRFWYDDFEKAAAYYDSAAQKKVPADKLPEGFQASELAESFGAYARLKSEIALQDSLLHLGRLSPEEFDSALTKLREQKLKELEQLKSEQQERNNRLVTIDQNQNNQTVASNSKNGFLNENNPVVKQNVRQQFYAYWGERPLADNWRVRALISNAAMQTQNNGRQVNSPSDSPGSNLVSIEIDLSAIPFEPEEQDSVMKLISSKQYQLGNLFFLSLDDPDSAAHYFKKAINNPSDQNINTVSLYSLSELYTVQGKEEEAMSYARQLVQEYPDTEYARRVAEKFGLEKGVSQSDGLRDPKIYFREIVNSDSLDDVQKADSLYQFGIRNPNEDIAPRALLESIQLYSKAGKGEKHFRDNYEPWLRKHEQWDEKQESFMAEKDSVKNLLQDSTFTEVRARELQALLDSTLKAPEFDKNTFPYRGKYWDQARAAIDTFLVMYPSSSYRPKVSRLNTELTLPGEKVAEVESQPVEEAAEEATPKYLKCADIEQELKIRGRVDLFMRVVEMPKGSGLKSVTYMFKVNQRGIIEDYSLQTEEVPVIIQKAFKPAIENSLRFNPVIYQGQAVPAECPFTFPVK